MFDDMTSKEFFTVEDREKLLFSSYLDSILKFVNSYTSPKIRFYSSSEVV